MAPRVVDFTEREEVCSLHGTTLQTEEVSVLHGNPSRYDPFDFEDYAKFPFANDNGYISLKYTQYANCSSIDSARISFCPDCRKVKAAELESIEQRREEFRQKKLMPRNPSGGVTR